MNTKSQYTELAKEFLKGRKINQIRIKGREYTFNKKQAEFISNFNNKDKFILFSGGRGCGKSLALCVKLFLTVKCFPGIRVLLGRKNLSDIEKTTLQDFFKLVPPMEYEHRVKDGLINFKNGSQIVLMGLDAMQSGNVGDMKKAQQKTKSLNIGAYFIDQLEEIEYDVFQALNDTMRMTVPPGSDMPDYPRQGIMTCNPANFWAYHYFKREERMDSDGNWLPKIHADSLLIEGSMLDNQANLPPDFVRDRMSREENYVRRFVHGEWNMDILTKGAVFAKEHIAHLEALVRPPLRTEEGCEIYEDPRDVQYRMGVDPSEGVVDPSSITVISEEGRMVAKFNGMVPIPALADKVKFLYYKYRKPLIIPESNTGAALIREIRDLRVFRRKTTDERWDRETEKLGFRMSWESKQQLINHFLMLLRKRVPKIYSRKTIEEMKVFIWSDEANESGAGASRGFHDDDIISMLLAFWDWTPSKSERQLAAKSQHIPTKRYQYT